MIALLFAANTLTIVYACPDAEERIYPQAIYP